MANVTLPMGFGSALVQNERAMQKFESMTEDEKKAVIERTHHINSKNQMRAFVNSLAEGYNNTKTATNNQWVSTGLDHYPDDRRRRDGPGGEDADN